MFRKAAHPENYWLPCHGVKDTLTGFYALHLKANGEMEACLAPGLWRDITKDKQSFYQSICKRD